MKKGMRYYSFDVNYNNEPDVFTYYFRARSASEVSRATGVNIDLIFECTSEEAHRSRHIDTVVNGRLIEQD